MDVKPTLHLDSASCLPPIHDADRWHPNRPPVKAPLRLCAMAAAPSWLRDITHGNAEHAYAVGDEVPLLNAALDARRRGGLFGDVAAVTAYREALEARWRASVGVFAPGVWTWATWRAGNVREVRDGSWIVCTCARGVECHTEWLAPHLQRAGWTVILRGQPLETA